MSLSSTINRWDYVGNGSTPDYDYTSRIIAETDIYVYVLDSDGAQTTLVLGTDFSVDGVGNQGGGQISLIDNGQEWLDADGDLDTGWSITIRRIRPLTQIEDIRNQGTSFRSTIEDQFDHLVMIDQQQQEDLDRSLKFTETSEFSGVTIPELEANKYLKVNADGDGFEFGEPSTTVTDYNGTFSAGADASKPASPTTNDLYLATDTKILYACFSSGTWTNIANEVGLDASKAASPKAGQTYFATDTGKVYRCFVAGTWTTAMTFGHTVTMSGAAVNFAKGSNIASATTCDIGAATGNFVHITGTTTITGLGTVQAGTHRVVTFDGILTLTHNATSLILPGAANITTAAGDCAIFKSEGSGNWRCISYQKASGYSVIVQGGGILGSCKNKYVTRPSVTQVTFTADEIVLEDSSNNKFSVRSVNVTAAITTSGANGLDTGAEGSSRWYAIWLIRKSSDGTLALLLSESSSSPTMPTGYDQKALVSGVYNNSGSDLVDFVHEGSMYMYTAPGSMVSGDNSGVLTSFSTAAFMPSFLSTCILMKLDDGGVTAAVSPVSTGIGSYEGNKFLTGSDSSYAGELVVMRPRTANTLYYSGTGVSCNLYCHGFIVNKLGC